MEWLAFVVTLLGIMLNAKKIIWCWPAFLVGNVLWIIHFWPLHEVAVIIMNFIMIGFDFYGWHQWRLSGGLGDGKEKI